MIYDKSNWYYRFDNELNFRLDFIHYHPDLDILDRLEKLTDYKVNLINDFIKDDSQLTSGKTPKGVKYNDDGIIFLGASNINNGELDLSSTVKIPEKYHIGELKSSQLKKGDVLISMAGQIGKCCVYLSDEEANANQAIAILSIDDKILLPEYLVKYFNSKIGQYGFTKYRHDVLQPNINLEEIKLIKVIYPEDIKEQLNILNKIKPIEKESKRLENKAIQLQEEANNYLLKELDIPIPENTNYFFKSGAEKQTVTFYKNFDDLEDRQHYLYYHPRYKLIDEFKKKYKTLALKDICLSPITRGEQPEYDDLGEYMVIKTVDLKNRFIGYNNTLKVSEDFFNYKSNAHVKKYDILFSSTGFVSLGKVDVYDIDEQAIIDGHISLIRINENYDPYFIAYFLRSHLGQIQIEKYWTGASGQIELQPHDLENIFIPSIESIKIETQKRISAIIRDKIQESIKLEKQAESKRKVAMELFERLILEGNQS